MPTKAFLITPALLAIALVPQIALSQTCQPVAGTIDASVLGGEPVNVLGSVSGGLAGATRAVLTGRTEGENGTVDLTLTHDFVTADRSTLQTKDTAVWTPVPGRTGVYHMATDYQITGGTGAYAGATGTLRNEGIADTTTGLVTLRYEGEVCTETAS